MPLQSKLGFLQQNLPWEKRKAVVPRLIRDLSPDPSGFSVEPRGRQRFAPQHMAARGGKRRQQQQQRRRAQLPESVTPAACIILTSSRCRSPPGLPRTTCRRSSRTRREATSPRPPGTPRRRRRDCMVQVAPRDTSGDYGARRRPGTLQEAVQRAEQEAAGRRVRWKLLPPAHRAPRCGAGPGRRTGGMPAGRIGPVHHPGSGHPTDDPELRRCQRPLAPSVQRLQCSFLGCEPSVLGRTVGFP